jgi:hypothetical protein
VTRFDWDVAVWGAWFAIFVVLELLGNFNLVPWNTLSSFSWQLERLSDWVKLLFFAGLAILLVHITFRWP